MLIKIPVKGKPELQFWIRAFKLESEVQRIVDILNADINRVKAFVPIIAEYESGSVRWVYLLGMGIDSLGVIEGEGVVWYTNSKAHFEQAIKARNELANYVVEKAREQKKLKEFIEMEPEKDV